MSLGMLRQFALVANITETHGEETILWEMGVRCFVLHSAD